MFRDTIASTCVLKLMEPTRFFCVTSEVLSDLHRVISTTKIFYLIFTICTSTRLIAFFVIFQIGVHRNIVPVFIFFCQVNGIFKLINCRTFFFLL